MSDLIETVQIDGQHYTEIRLTSDNEIQIYAEAEASEIYTYSIDQAKEIVAALNHMIWNAEH